MTGPINALLGAMRPNRGEGRGELKSSKGTPGSADIPTSRLLIDITHGDLNALGELYDRYAITCWAIAKGHTADKTLAAAAVTKAFLDVWRQPPIHAADQLGAHLAELTRGWFAAQGQGDDDRELSPHLEQHARGPGQ